MIYNFLADAVAEPDMAEVRQPEAKVVLSELLAVLLQTARRR